MNVLIPTARRAVQFLAVACLICIHAIHAQTPTLTSISPSSGTVGTSVPVTLTGTNFVSGATVSVSDPITTASGVTVVSPTQITATLIINPFELRGSLDITVTTSGGTSNPVSFTVTFPPPIISSLQRTNGVQGSTVSQLITGSNMAYGATVAVSNPGVTVTSLTVVSSMRIMCHFDIAANAALGPTDVTVTTAAGTSNALVFTVKPPPPTLTSVAPSIGAQGAALPVTLTGTNFVSGATVAVSNGGITVSSITVVSSTQITATFAVAANAALGAANVTVTTSGGTSGAAGFTVTAPPSVTGLLPPSGPAGTTVTITGSNFGAAQGASTVTFNGTNAGTATNWSDNIITVSVPGGATTGNVVVTVGGLSAPAGSFTVIVPPSITSVWPTSGPVGTAVTITGANFGAIQGSSTVTFGGVNADAIPYWSATSITVVVPSGALTGNAVVTVGGLGSNGAPFTVTMTPVISSLSAPSHVPGATVTISGTGFGTAQGIGQVWLGNTYGNVVSWSETQVVATIALTSRSGLVQVLQSGVWSNAMPFDIDTVTITEVLPTKSGYPGDAITIKGSGFGNIQGTGTVQLGSTNGIVLNSGDWSDAQIVALVAASSVTGIARVQQGGIPSNAVTFTVLGGSGTAVTLAPNLLNLVVGDTRTIQALSAASQLVTGLTWASSDTNVVSLSSADPPELTALAPGHVTITAGTASADVTVWPDTLPQGTVLWSNPGNGSGVYSIVPAVPSATGVADVFAFQYDGTVQAITADGLTAWTADVSDAWPVLPDFQGGLVLAKSDSIVKLDGATGQRYSAYTVGEGEFRGTPVVHPDGTVFTVSYSWLTPVLIAVDSSTGAEKFRITIPRGGDYTEAGDLIIAGDGYAYVPFANRTWLEIGEADHLALLRVSSDGAYDVIPVMDWTGFFLDVNGVARYVNMITNADTGVLLTWPIRDDWHTGRAAMAITTGTSVSVINAPVLPENQPVVPVLQAQDGSFVGTYDIWTGQAQQTNMVAFDTTGTVRWTVAGYKPKIATADGGVIATDESGTAVTFDKDGNVTGQMGRLPRYSWKGAYQVGSIESIIPSFDLALIAATFAAVPAGNLTGNGFSLIHHTFGLVFCGPSAAQGPYVWDGQCNNLPAGLPSLTPVTFSYLPASQLSGQTYTTAVDFRSEFPAWPNIIKAQAYNQYRQAFEHLPAIVAKTDAMYGGSSAKSFEHTVYITGLWRDEAMGQTPQNALVCRNFTNSNLQPYCSLSYLYYLSYMEQAQQALGYLLAGGAGQTPPVSPQYPPASPTSLVQFQQLMNAIGFGIGTGAAHETAHQLLLPNLDCGSAGHYPCQETRVYENGIGTSTNEWFYGNLPGVKIHWSQSTACAISRYLLGNSEPCN